MRRPFPLFLAFMLGAMVAPEPLHAAAAPNPRFTGAPFLRAWSAEDYAAAPVNYQLLQHPTTGCLYAANDYGVLEFDGATWRLIEMPNAVSARALAIDRRGRVWVGGVNDIALLAPDARGTLRALSVLDRLPASARSVGIVQAATASPDGVYFVSPAGIVFFGLDGPARAWTPPQRFTTLLWFGNALHGATADGGLFALTGDSFAPEIAPRRDGAPPAVPIFSAQARPGGGWELLTARGPAHWAGPGAPLVPAETEANRQLAAEPAASGVFLRDGRFAFGRAVGGVTLFDRAGHFLQTIDRTRGLSGNRVEHLCEDTEGGLWIAQRSGLARVQLDSPFAKHGVAQGVDGRPRALHRHDGRLYLAHNEGAAWRDDATGQFHAVSGLEVGLKRFLSIGPRLLSTSTSLYEVDAGGAAHSIARLTLTPLVPVPGTSPTAPWLLGGGTAKIWLFEPTPGSWKLADSLANVPAGAESLLPTADGNVWGSSIDGRIWRMDFRGGPKLDVPVAPYGPEKGVPPIRRRDDAELFALGSELLAISGAWILRYDRATDRFTPDTQIADLPANVGATRAHSDASGTLWLQVAPPDGRLLRIRPAADGKFRAEPLAVPTVAGLVANRIYHDEAAQTLWLASQGALVSVDLAWHATHPLPPPRVLIRRVESAARELIFDGAADSDSPASSLTLDADHNALRFTFAAPAFDGDFLGRAQTEYRTRLDGLEAEWTPWSGDTVREFSNLPFRALTFRVEARGPDGRSGAASMWAFSITPPWWLTRWAMSGYALGGLLGIAGLVRWRTQSLRRRGLQLEHTIAARTEELRASNTELARLNAIERDEKLAARLDEEKARLEMLRYQLNPHFLYNTLASISGTAVANPTATRTMAQRLADFCRLTLTRADETETVREELRMLRSYLDIEQARWRDSLQIKIDVADEALDCRLPTFLLLPLLENAIKHGGETTRGTLQICLAIHATAGGGLAIEVANTGTWGAPSRRHSTGIGLENLRRRLARYFPDAHTFTIGPEGEFVIARLTLATVGGALRPDGILAIGSSGHKAPPTI